MYRPMTDANERPSGAPRINPRRDAAGDAAPDAARPEPPREEVEETSEGPSMTLRGAPVTIFLLIVNIAIELVLISDPALRNYAISHYAFGMLYDQGTLKATMGGALVTHAFLHGGLLHLGFNMAALAIFGPPVERSLRSPVYLAAYLLCAVAGCYFVYAWTLGVELFGLGPGRGTVLVGASGAISGLIAFEFYRRYLILSRMPRRLRPEAPATHLLRLSALFLGVNLAIILLPGQISGEAHIGGYLAGIALAPLAMRRISD